MGCVGVVAHAQFQYCGGSYWRPPAGLPAIVVACEYPGEQKQRLAPAHISCVLPRWGVQQLVPTHGSPRGSSSPLTPRTMGGSIWFLLMGPVSPRAPGTVGTTLARVSYSSGDGPHTPGTAEAATGACFQVSWQWRCPVPTCGTYDGGGSSFLHLEFSFCRWCPVA